MVIPKPFLQTPEDCIQWALLQAEQHQKPITLRDAKRLIRPQPADHAAFSGSMQALLEQGDVALYHKRPGLPGRPTNYYYPTFCHVTKLQDTKIKVAQTDQRPHPPLDKHMTRLVKATLPPSVSAEVMPHAAQSLALIQDPYELMRRTISKSMRERNHGPTESELTWVLVKKGFTEQEAEEHLAALSRTNSAAYLAGGLVAQSPHGVHNKTEQTRYAVRTPGQALPLHIAEFEAMKARSSGN